MVKRSFSIDILDDANYRAEEHTALSEVPQRRLVYNVLLGECKIEVNQQMAEKQRNGGRNVVDKFSHSI